MSDEDSIGLPTLVTACRRAGCHDDFIRYIEEADSIGGTPILSSLKQFHRESDVERMSEVGTRIERTLWNKGAYETLLECGNLDDVNRPLLERIVRENLDRGRP
jgi:hypothetical protein